MAERLEVEVVYAAAASAHKRRLSVPKGTTVAEAVALSGLASVVQGVDVGAMPVACFGRRVEPAAAVAEGDRLELLRPLQVDPREARRARRAAR